MTLFAALFIVLYVSFWLPRNRAWRQRILQRHWMSHGELNRLSTHLVGLLVAAAFLALALLFS